MKMYPQITQTDADSLGTRTREPDDSSTRDKSNIQCPACFSSGNLRKSATSADNFRKRQGERGIALVIVLAFVVLLTGLVVAYFSRSLSDRKLSNSSFNQAKADELARSALDILTSNLKQEIVNGSDPDPKYTVNGIPIYPPTSNANMVPKKNGVPAIWGAPWGATAPNGSNTTLVRISTPTAIPGPGVDQRSSNATSTGTSANGRTITTARWNRHYLIPFLSANQTDTTPVSSFIAPSWVYVTGTGGPAIPALAAPSTSVIGRYAFAIYDEGALLDMNAAGYPVGSGTSIPPQYVPKGALAFADLTSLLTGILSPTSPTQTGVNSLVGWRNYASMRNYDSTQPAGTFPNFTFSGNAVHDSYKKLIASNANGSMKISGTAVGGLTDQAFLTRQELINLALAIGTTNFNPNALQYLGTFSRAAAAPSWKPTATIGTPAGNTIDYAGQAENTSSANRNLANVRFSTSGNCTHWTDGTVSGNGTMIAPPTSGNYTVSAADPLLQGRFSLAKIAWLSQANPDTGAAPPSNYATAIQACFGLTWGTPTGGAANGGNPCWIYVGPTGSSPVGTIETLNQVAAEGREPNFFELLKAAILNGSIGVSPGIACFQNGTVAATTRGNSSPGSFTGSYHPPGSYPGTSNIYAYSFDRIMYTPPAAPARPAPAGISDMQIMQVGANIIDQYDADSYPTAIYFRYTGMTAANDAAVPGNQIFGPSDMVYGDENLPYLQGMVHIFATVDGEPKQPKYITFNGSSTYPYGYNTTPTGGMACWWQPVIWNPHQMPNPANSSVPPPTNYQINGYTGSGGIKFFWSDQQWSLNGTLSDPGDPTATPPIPPHNATPRSPAASVRNNLLFSPTPLDNAGVPIQYITFTDTAPTNSAFYAQPLLLQSSGIRDGFTGTSIVTATASQPEMLADTYPDMVHSLKGLGPNPTNAPDLVKRNRFVGFWAGTDPTYLGCACFLNVEAQASGPVTFCLGWTDSSSRFHPYSYLPGEFTWTYGVVDNGPRDGTASQGGAMPQDSSTTGHKFVDPRTMRFGATTNWQVVSTAIMWGVTTIGQTIPTHFWDSTHHGIDGYGWGQPYSPNFTYDNSSGYGYYVGDWLVNQPVPLAQTKATATYYKDTDGVVRPADGVFGNTATGDGMLLFSSTGTNTGATTPALGDIGATGNTRHGRRPVILNRPFRSVGELGYTFRDLPFKSLDFFTKSSADAALLDVFSISDQSRVSSNGQLTSVVAGQVNLNNAPFRVIMALLAGGSKKDYDSGYNLYASGSINTQAQTIAQAIVTELTANGPLANRADLATRLGADPATGNGVMAGGIGSVLNTPDRNNKAYLEASVRALADVTNTRTWNLMIDVIAQTGSFSPSAPATAAALNSSFNVQGERRYWLHVAIDRFTGKVIDQQLEPVYE